METHRHPDRSPALAALHAFLARGRGRWVAGAGAALLLLMAAMALRSPGVGGADSATGERRAAARGGAGPCSHLLEHEAWTGRVSFANSRDVAGARRGFHIAYDMAVDAHADLSRESRPNARRAPTTMQYGNTSPRGRVAFEYARTDRTLGHARFTGDGRLRAHESGMPEGGSKLTLRIKADCSYVFFFHGNATGTWMFQEPNRPPASREGTMGVLAVSGNGTMETSGQIRDTRDFKAYGDPMVTGQQLPTGEDRAVENGDIHEALGPDMGTVEVSWEFSPLR